MRKPQDTGGDSNINGHKLEETILREDRDDGLATSLHYRVAVDDETLGGIIKRVCKATTGEYAAGMSRGLGA